MSVWVECFVSIRFDLDIGPKVEHVAPHGVLSEEGAKKVIHAAFPDCNPDSGHDFIFFFTMKDCTNAAIESQSRTVANPATGSTVPLLWGAAYYRQKRDPRVPRGFVQQMVVLLSRIPYITVHELILRTVMPRFCQCCPLSPDTECTPASSCLMPIPTAYFDFDFSFNKEHFEQSQVLDLAMEEISTWSSPHPHVKYNVMLLHQGMEFVTPARSLRPSRTQHHAIQRPALKLDEHVVFLGKDDNQRTSQDAIPLYTLLSTHIRHLTRIWELLISHEHLFILSTTPSMASATAFAFVSLVMPIQFNGELRSYFTVQAEDFARFTRLGNAIPFPEDKSYVVAATNPFFIRSFSGWRNIVWVVDQYSNSTQGVCLNRSGVGSGRPLPGSPHVGGTPGRHLSPLHSFSPNDSVAHPSAAPGAVAEISRSILRLSSGIEPNPSGDDSTASSAGQCSSPLRRSIGTPVFTRQSYEHAFATATQPAARKSASSREALQHSPSSDFFESPFSFLLDHSDLTKTLLDRLQRVSELDGKAQLAFMQQYSRSTVDRSTTEVPLSSRQNSTNSSGSPLGESTSFSCGPALLRPTSHPVDASDPARTRSGAEGARCPQSENRYGNGASSRSWKTSNTTQPCLSSQFSIADDVLRKFFVSLTLEFLSPINMWFRAVTSQYSSFLLCDPATAQLLLTKESFLQYFSANHKTVVPKLVSHRSHKSYRVIYERFAGGSLFTGYVAYLLDAKLRRELDEFQSDVWAQQFPTEAERIDHFINIHGIAQREQLEALDPDFIFVTTATSVLAGMALYIKEPLREQLLSKVDALKL